MSFSVPRDAELIDSIVGRQKAAAALEAANATAMIEFVELRRAEGERTLGGHAAGRLEAGTAVFELSLALRLPVATVEMQLARARRVRSLLPAVWAAWLSGELTGLKIARIDEAAGQLTTSAAIGLLDQKVVALAVRKTPGQLQSWLTKFVAQVEAERAQQRARSARRERRVWISPDYDSVSWLTAKLESLDAAEIDARLDALARAAGSDDGRTMDQRRADAFRDLLLGRIANGSSGGAPQPPASQTVIGVVVPIQSLVGEAELPGETFDRSMSVPADIVRERATQPGTLFWRLLTDARGHLLDATQLGRFPNDKLGFAVKVRDGHSVFPTSSVPAFRCDLDHSCARCEHPRCDDPAHGPTTASNLGALDRRSHNVKTSGGLTLRQTGPGIFEWTTRTGHSYTNRAEPLPVAGWPAPDEYFWQDPGPAPLSKAEVMEIWDEAFDPDSEAA